MMNSLWYFIQEQNKIKQKQIHQRNILCPSTTPELPPGEVFPGIWQVADAQTHQRGAHSNSLLNLG